MEEWKILGEKRTITREAEGDARNPGDPSWVSGARREIKAGYRMAGESGVCLGSGRWKNLVW